MESGYFHDDDTGEEIKAVEESFPDSSVFLCHFHILRSWRRKLNYKHDASQKLVIWDDLWRLMKTEGWDDSEAQEQII